MRIGHGYDVHRLDKKRKLILGGVLIEHTAGLLGHSDADVLVHAIMDALLGAAALGDIGLHFPDSDNTFKNADSVELLKKVCDIINDKGYVIENLDCTIIAQRPKLRPYIPQMTQIICDACKINLDQVNIKATTEENLGFTGEELGMSAHCLCLLNNK